MSRERLALLGLSLLLACPNCNAILGNEEGQVAMRANAGAGATLAPTAGAGAAAGSSANNGGGAGIVGSDLGGAGAAGGDLGGAGAASGAGPDLGGAGPDLGGAGATGSDECESGQQACFGNALRKCKADGSGYEPEETPCAADETCVGASCLKHECEPGTSFCADEAVHLCAENGLSSSTTTSCAWNQYCDQASTSCQSGVCAAGQSACDVNVKTSCNADGSGYTGLRTDCGSDKTCEAGECQPHNCQPDSKVCLDNGVKTCAPNGLTSSVEACTGDTFCAEGAGTATCQPRVCQPNEPSCEGNTAHVCDEIGSGFVDDVNCTDTNDTCVAGVCQGSCAPGQFNCSLQQPQKCSPTGAWIDNGAACSASKTCSADVGKCQGDCGPGQRQCKGQQPQQCDSTGYWINSGAACSGANLCDALGGTKCTTSPLVPGGTFNRHNDPNFSATVADFRLDRYEVTVAQFRTFVLAAVDNAWRPTAGSGKHTHLNAGKGLLSAVGSSYETGWDIAWNTTDNFPVSHSGNPSWAFELLYTNGNYSVTAGTNENEGLVMPNWYQAYAYCIWRGGFLPTEAEWSFAAVGGDEQRKFPWGSTEPSTNVILANYGCYSLGGLTCSQSPITNYIRDVGASPMGNGRWGHSDLVGNTEEWLLDAYADLTTPCVNCALLSGASRVNAGGFWSSSLASLSAPGSKASLPPSSHYVGTGFRCAYAP